MPAFNLRDNAFALLATHPRANRAQLEDAYQDAFLDAEDHESEARLNRAQQFLISPRERLDSELSFFVDTKPATIKEVLAAIGTPAPRTCLDLLTGLDRANYLAHLCNDGPDDDRRSAALGLIAAYDTVEPAGVLEAVNVSRSVSGFGQVDLAATKAGLTKVCSSHSSAILDALMKGLKGPDDVADLASGLADCGPRKRTILEGVLREYETRVGPKLETGTDDIRLSLVALAEQRGDNTLIDQVAEKLRSWDRMAQPLQVADRARGIDEHHSRHLFEVVRETTLDLANARGLYEQSLKISEIALEVFAELPDAAQKLADDIATLKNLVAEKRQNVFLTPLAEAVEEAQANHSATCRAIEKSGFSATAGDPVGKIQRAFLAIVNGQSDQQLNGMAARLVRSLGIDLCNESSNNEGAAAIIQGLLQYRQVLPGDVIDTLENDRDTLRKNIDFNALMVAMKASRWNDAERLVESLIANADEESLPDFLRIRSVIAERKQGRITKLIGWGVLAAIILFVAFSGRSNNSSSYVADQSASDAADAAADAASDAAVETADTSSETEDSPIEAETSGAAIDPVAATSDEESPPAANQPYSTVTLSELRYCKRQKARLSAVQNDILAEGQIGRLNAAIDDYNARCGSFRYNQSDMDQVERDVPEAATSHSEGLEIVGGAE